MANGIIRRIDDLGRIVIPKEIRRVFRIHEGDPLEISVSDSCITLIPYRVKDLKELSMPLLAAFYRQLKIPVAICDQYEIIASKGINCKPPAKISGSLKFHIRHGAEYLTGHESFDAFLDSDEIQAGAVLPIIADGYRMGGVVLFYRECEPLTKKQITCARFMAEAISNQLSSEGIVCRD